LREIFKYDQEDIPAVDETGETIGTIRFTGEMRFHLVDQSNGGSIRYDRDINGSTELEFVWDPAGKANEPEVVTPILTRTKDVPGPDDINSLGQPYPNPFN